MELASVTKKKKTNSKKSDFFEKTPAKVNLKDLDKKKLKTKEPKSNYLAKNNPKTRLKRVKQKVKDSSTTYSKHKSTDDVEKENKNAAILPAIKINKIAAETAQVKKVAAEETNPFDKESFKSNLRESINNTIKSSDDANDIKKDGLDENFKNSIKTEVDNKTEKAGGNVKETNNKEPQTPENEISSQNPIEIPQKETLVNENISKNVKVAPGKRSANEVDFNKGEDEANQLLEQNNLSDEKLQNSKEPRLIETANTKQNAKEIATANSQNYIDKEKQTIQNTSVKNRSKVNKESLSMLGFNSLFRGNVQKKQAEKKDNEVSVREAFATKIQEIHTDTKAEVDDCFTNIDNYITKTFNTEIKNKSDIFKDRVTKLIDDNDGIEAVGKFFTGQRIHSDKESFNTAKNEFNSNMQIPIDNLTLKVEEQLKTANQAIKDGKEDVKKAWESLPKNVKTATKGLVEDSNKQFGELEKSVKDKESSVVSTVTELYNEAYNGLNEIYEKALEDSKSWWQKAIDAVKGIIDTLVELKKTFDRIAAKAAKYSEAIMDAPGEFFDNLATGIGQGFINFKNNIDKHLVKGVLTWLTGSMGGIGIVLPEKLDLGGILSLVLQILGISVEKIKLLIKKQIGEKRYKFLEKGIGLAASGANKILNIIQILNEKGIAGLWEFIKEEIVNLKQQFIEMVVKFLTETLINKAIETLLFMLIPGAGIIKAIEMLINFVSTLFAKANEIMQIIEAIIDTFGDILAKKVDGVAKRVEMIFSGFLSLAISFLAGVLGLNKLAKKVQKAIKEKIRPKVDVILKKITKKVKEIADKIGVTKLVDKSMKAVDKAKEKGKKIASKFLGWLGLKKEFKASNGKSHSVNIEQKGSSPKIVIRSKPNVLSEFISNFKKTEKYKKNKKDYDKKIKKAKSINNSFMKALEKNDKEMKTAEKEKKFNDFAKSLISYVQDMFGSSNKKRNIKFKGLKGEVAKGMEANPLINDDTKGSKTSAAKGVYLTLFERRYNKSFKSPYYIQGHLLNDRLGGPNKKENLTPLTRNANSEHERIIEKSLKHFYEENNELYYKVIPKYGLSSPNINSSSPIKSNINKIKKVERENVPTHLEIKSAYLDKKSKKKKTIFNGDIQNNVAIDEKQYFIKK